MNVLKMGNNNFLQCPDVMLQTFSGVRIKMD